MPINYDVEYPKLQQKYSELKAVALELLEMAWRDHKSEEELAVLEKADSLLLEDRKESKDE